MTWMHRLGILAACVTLAACGSDGGGAGQDGGNTADGANPSSDAGLIADSAVGPSDASVQPSDGALADTGNPTDAASRPTDAGTPPIGPFDGGVPCGRRNMCDPSTQVCCPGCCPGDGFCVPAVPRGGPRVCPELYCVDLLICPAT